MNIVNAILYKYPNANSQRDFRVEDRGEGQFLADWHLSETEPTQAELEEWWKEYKRNEKLLELKRNVNEAILGNFISPTTGHEYEFSEYDQANFTQQMLLLVADPTITTVDWKTVDAGIISHTRDQFFAIVNDANAHKRGNLSKFWNLEAQLKLATTIPEIEAIVWT